MTSRKTTFIFMMDTSDSEAQCPLCATNWNGECQLKWFPCPGKINNRPKDPPFVCPLFEVKND